MDYFSTVTAHPASYFGETPESASTNNSNASSEQTIPTYSRVASVDSSIFPADQVWDPTDLDPFSAFADIADAGFCQEPVESDLSMVPPSKVASGGNFFTCENPLYNPPSPRAARTCADLPVCMLHSNCAYQARHFRRRAQNRASQRAFRERKERHVKGLETQLERLYEKHQDLICSYSRQAEGIEKLHSKITKLTGDLENLRAVEASAGKAKQKQDDLHVLCRRPATENAERDKKGLGGERNVVCKNAHATLAMPEKFDAFAFVTSLSPESPMPPEQDPTVLYDGYELGLDAALSNAPPIQTLPDFEDLLDWQ